MLFARKALALSLSLIPLSSFADTLWLDNGDRITGKIEFLEAGKMSIKTEFAGLITVKTDRVVTFETGEPLLLKLGDKAQYITRLQASEQKGQVTLAFDQQDDQSGGQNRSVPVQQISQLLVPKPVIQDMVWEGDASAALELKDTSGTETEDLDLDLSTRLRHGDWRHDLALDYERDYRDDVKSRHAWETDYDINRFLTENWFWMTSFRYQRDYLNEIAKQKQFGMGPGYEWWNNSLGRFETSARLDRIWTEERSGNKNKYNALGLQWDYRRFLVGKRFELFHKAETQIPDDPNVRYQIDTEAGVRYSLTSWAALSLKAELDYLNTSDDTGYRDTRYTMGLGVGW
ncbi:MAG: DUF481 domain-containing protein [Halopseudomonas sp.]|uniref:DUF481 domain-containing protein n=1 Tax=Halopseudomonas sp. TaxID=2901191 RepID=UPI003003823A